MRDNDQRIFVNLTSILGPQRPEQSQSVFNSFSASGRHSNETNLRQPTRFFCLRVDPEIEFLDTFRLIKGNCAIWEDSLNQQFGTHGSDEYSGNSSLSSPHPVSQLLLRKPSQLAQPVRERRRLWRSSIDRWPGPAESSNLAMQADLLRQRHDQVTIGPFGQLLGQRMAQDLGAPVSRP